MVVAIFCLAIIGLYIALPYTPKEKYEIIIDNVVKGYPNSTLVFHATIKTDYHFLLPSGWDYDNDGTVDLAMRRIDTSIINRPIELPWDYYSYGPWKKKPADNEYRYFAYGVEQTSDVYHYTFMLRGVDGWIKKPVLVRIAQPVFNITFSPVKESFLKGENIVLKAHITNNGPYPLRCMQPSIFSGTLDTFVTIPNGTVLHDYVPPDGPVIPREEAILLKSGESYDSTKVMDNPVAELNLTSRYFFLGNESVGITDYDFNDTGRYTVRFEYGFWDGFGWINKIGYETQFEVV